MRRWCKHPVIAFDEGGSLEALIFPDLSYASGWMEAIDVDDGEYGETAWLDDGEVVRTSVEEVARGDRRVRLTPTGHHDVPELRRRLARAHPELAEASTSAIQAFTAAHLAVERAWRESHWQRRLSRWMRRRLQG
ncbi:MAG: hypothetical protein ACRYF3_12430 [Janthinobacterium lividum]